MAFQDTQNPGIGGLDELTDAETLVVQQISALGDPNADRILFWDDSAGAFAYLTVGSGLSITNTTITATGATLDGSGTTNEIAYWVDSDTLGALAVATYPSLTELSYVKGVTSAIQTQLGTKAPSTSPTFATSITGSYLTASEILITDGSKNIVSAAVATYPSLTELSYVKGVTSAIQTQFTGKASTTLNNLGTTAINAHLLFDTDATYDIGSSTVGVNDLHFGLAGVINFDGGDVTLTHSANLLTLAGGNLALGANSITMTGSIAATGARVTKGWFTDIESTNMPTVGGTAILTSLTAPQFTTIELGAASDTTLSRVSAGVIAVEGVTVATASNTLTLSNKSIGAGALTLEENASIALDPAGSADGKYTGLTVAGTAGEALAFGDVIVLDVTAGKWFKGSVSAAAGADGDLRGGTGMCVLAAAGDASATTVLLMGTCRADANFPALTIGSVVYASTTGDITVTQPSTTDHIIKVLGYALTADEIMFCPSMDYITHT